jgi:hypothetical protein
MDRGEILRVQLKREEPLSKGSSQGKDMSGSKKEKMFIITLENSKTARKTARALKNLN